MVQNNPIINITEINAVFLQIHGYQSVNMIVFPFPFFLLNDFHNEQIYIHTINHMKMMLQQLVLFFFDNIHQAVFTRFL